MWNPNTLLAQVYNGGGIKVGIQETNSIANVANGNVRDIATKILNALLNFLALIAVTMIVIAGLYLILGLGEEEAKEKAKKIIQYTLIGLIVVLFSKVIVSFVTVYLASQAT